MKIGQAIDMIVEDNDLELEWGYYELVYDDMTSTIKAVRKRGTPLTEPFEINPLERQWLSANWELIQKPVTFMEAVKSGKSVRVEHTLIRKMYKDFDRLDLVLSVLSNEFNESDVSDILINGDWYIEEED